jgi:hypothetical protein
MIIMSITETGGFVWYRHPVNGRKTTCFRWYHKLKEDVF